MFGDEVDGSQVQVHREKTEPAVAVARGRVGAGGVRWVGCALVSARRPDRGDMGEGIVKRGGNGDGESARPRRLERGRDRDCRRECGRQAERAVRVVILATAVGLLRGWHRRALLRGRQRRRARRRTDHGVAVHLAVEPASSEGRGEDAADPGLVLVVALSQRPRAALLREVRAASATSATS